VRCRLLNLETLVAEAKYRGMPELGSLVAVMRADSAEARCLAIRSVFNSFILLMLRILLKVNRG
jgi:hypothetical protein